MVIEMGFCVVLHGIPKFHVMCGGDIQVIRCLPVLTDNFYPAWHAVSSSHLYINPWGIKQDRETYQQL